jgi:hypothetical protein
MLYHFSEDPNINEFVPRSMECMPPVVWAIDEEHSFFYFFPRDCPRVIFSWSQVPNLYPLRNAWVHRRLLIFLSSGLGMR